jgi:mannose-6-phosphate isomerase
MPQLLQRLKATAYEKVWGTTNTEPWWRNPERKQIGEVWFTASASTPLLVKFLFTSDNLSVQVHPGDAYARKHANDNGKTEMWHVLRAEPGARVALGLNAAVSEYELAAACLSGKIVDLLNWVPAKKGDTFFTPAGTIHAIGGGLTICEIQQVSDTTYRLYDWGRKDRELHLEDGKAVSNRERHTGGACQLPVECKYFRTERLVVKGAHPCPAPSRSTIYIAIEGEGTIGGLPFVQGEAFEGSAGADPVEIASPNAVFLIAFAPSPPAP